MKDVLRGSRGPRSRVMGGFTERHSRVFDASITRATRMNGGNQVPMRSSVMAVRIVRLAAELGEPADGGRAAPSPPGGGSEIECVMSVERGLCFPLTSSKTPPWFPGVRMMWCELLSRDRFLASPRSVLARLSSASARPDLLHAWVRQEWPSNIVGTFTLARLCSTTGAE